MMTRKTYLFKGPMHNSTKIDSKHVVARRRLNKLFVTIMPILKCLINELGSVMKKIGYCRKFVSFRNFSGVGSKPVLGVCFPNVVVVPGSATII